SGCCGGILFCESEEVLRIKWDRKSERCLVKVMREWRVGLKKVIGWRFKMVEDDVGVVMCEERCFYLFWIRM
uniref:hypothetical protein n=1 Tax=Bacillus pumilus TaxID=1408 RepID=UPI001C92C4FB